MRRLLPFALLALLPGCDAAVSDYVANPWDGTGHFLADTHTYHRNVNRPDATVPNVQRAEGMAATTEPLLPEDGHVWPGPLPPSKTLADLQRETDGIGTGTGLPMSGGMAAPPPTPSMPALKITPAPINQPIPAPKPQSRVYQTPGGPAISSLNGGGLETFTMANGITGTVINNGNGTATLVRSDGVSLVVPMPR